MKITPIDLVCTRKPDTIIWNILDNELAATNEAKIGFKIKSIGQCDFSTLKNDTAILFGKDGYFELLNSLK